MTTGPPEDSPASDRLANRSLASTSLPGSHDHDSFCFNDRPALRSYLLSRGGGKQLDARARWKNSNASYASYREFLELWTAGKLPAAVSTANGSSRHCADASSDGDIDGVSVEHSAASSLHGTPRHPPSTQALQSTPFRHHQALPFRDMEVVIEGSEMPISVVKFATNSSDLLALADEGGQVRLIQLGMEAQVIQILEHEAGVADLDWSTSNTSILTCCEDGMVVIWGQSPDGWGCVRTFQTLGSATCCRYHPLNENFIIVGSALGNVCAMNTSTGATVSEYVLQTSSPEGVFAAALACTEALTFVGDSRGHLVVLDSGFGWSQTVPPLTLVTRCLPPTRERVPVLSIQHMPHGNCNEESSVLTYQADGCTSLWSVTWAEGRAPKVTRRLKAMIPAPSRYTNAIFCSTGPASNSTTMVALGCLHPGLTIYDLGNLNSSLHPAAVLQIQGHLSPVVALSWSSDQQVLAAGDVDGSLIIWHTQ